MGRGLERLHNFLEVLQGPESWDSIFKVWSFLVGTSGNDSDDLTLRKVAGGWFLTDSRIPNAECSRSIFFWGKCSDDLLLHNDASQRETGNSHKHLCCSQICNLSRVWKQQLFSLQQWLAGSSGTEDLPPRWWIPAEFIVLGSSPQNPLNSVPWVSSQHGGGLQDPETLGWKKKAL